MYEDTSCKRLSVHGPKMNHKHSAIKKIIKISKVMPSLGTSSYRYKASEYDYSRHLPIIPNGVFVSCLWTLFNKSKETLLVTSSTLSLEPFFPLVSAPCRLSSLLQAVNSSLSSRDTSELGCRNTWSTTSRISSVVWRRVNELCVYTSPISGCSTVQLQRTPS